MLVLVLKEVEGDGERVEVEGIGIVDEQAVIDSLIHLKTHLDGGKLGATSHDSLGGIAKVEHQSDAMHDVLLRGTVYKGYCDREDLILVANGEGRITVGDGGGEQTHCVVLGCAPSEKIDMVETLDVRQHRVNLLVIGGIDEHVAMGEEL